MAGRRDQVAAFVAAFVRYGGRDTLHAVLLVVAGSILEGFGLALLVPLLTFLVPTSSMLDPSSLGRWSGIAETVPPGWLRPAILTAFCLIVALRGAVLLGRDRLVDRLAFGFADSQRERVVTALANASWPVLAKLRHAQIAHILSAEVANAGTAARLLPQIVVAALMVSAQVVVLLLVSPTLASLALVLIVVGAVTLARVTRIAGATGMAGVLANFRIADQVAALLGGLKFAVAHGLRRDLVDRAVKEGAAYTALVLRQRRHTSRVSVASTSIAAFTGVALIALAPVLGLSGAALLAALAVLLRMSGPLRQLQSNVPQFAALLPAFAAASAQCAALERAAVPADAPAPAAPPAGAIALRGVGFAHETEGPAVLADVDLTIGAAEVVGLAGPSGVGKTTLLDILAGLRPPHAGTMTVDGTVLDGARLNAWRRGLAYVTQDTFLFDDDLRRNLLWGSIAADVDEDALWGALASVGLDDLVRALPEGLDTRVGERALRFSGGQRQRFALARAILRRPALLLLDEATSALDVEAERAVLAGLRRALPDVSVVLVSHRAAALAMCDRVVTLAGGRLVAAESRS